MCVNIYFSEFFGIDPVVLEEYGTVDVSLVSDLPLFIDPFLLFNSEDDVLRALHVEMMNYLKFLRDKSAAGEIRDGLLTEWFCFPEVRQLWMGYSAVGNEGSGLGRDFARKLHRNLNNVFSDFGNEHVTSGSHLEKLCLIEPGVGRDHIADFTANLIIDHLARYTQVFALECLNSSQRERRPVRRSVFNYSTESWVTREYTLPIFEGDFVLLAPRKLLTKDETWINRKDFVADLPSVINSVENASLRSSVNNYFLQILSRIENPTKADRRDAAEKTIRQFPMLVEYYIRLKELNGSQASALSTSRVEQAELQFIDNVRSLVLLLSESTGFFNVRGSSANEARARVQFLKDVIENKGGWKLFYIDGEPVRREADLQIVFRFVWCGTQFDVSREVDDGRGPADFKISHGLDKTIVEFKLATNRKLKQNLLNQTEVYQMASDAATGLKVIMYFDSSEQDRVVKILDELDMTESENIFLIDASPKGSGSNVK